jgi:hypothetical protein
MLGAMRRLIAFVFVGCAAPPQPAPPVPEPLPVASASAPASASVSAAPSAPTSATASFEVPVVEPVPGTVAYADQAMKAKLLPKSIVKTGDLVIGKTTISGPCYDVTRHSALIVGLVDDDGKPTVKLKDLAFDLDGDGKKDAVVEIDVSSVRRYALYVKRWQCGYFVGDVETSGELEATKEKANGFTVLTAVVVSKKGPATNQTQRVEFDGKAYVVK